MNDVREFVCCICGRNCTGWGNDPWPVVTEEDKECCEACNTLKVIPARIKALKNKKKGNR